MQVPARSFKVLAGESLWDMAKRTTGDATNWKTIAAANGMNEKEAALIKYGQTLDIPTALLKEGVTDAPSSATPSATVVALPEKTPATTEASVAEVKSVVAETAEATASATTTNDADAEMTIMPANFQADPPVIEAAQVEPVAAADSEAATTPPGNESVMVSGTYYPKAIYNDANFSATLLMRVSPGTELTVSRAIGPWFEVKTEKGIGYVHSRDIK